MNSKLRVVIKSIKNEGGSGNRDNFKRKEGSSVGGLEETSTGTEFIQGKNEKKKKNPRTSKGTADKKSTILSQTRKFRKREQGRKKESKLPKQGQGASTAGRRGGAVLFGGWEKKRAVRVGTQKEQPLGHGGRKGD